MRAYGTMRHDEIFTMTAAPILFATPALPRSGERRDLPALTASADALMIATVTAAVKANQNGALMAIIAASPLDAQRLHDEINWFAPTLRVHVLPDWETLPYDNFSPHQDLISERLATLHAIARGLCDVLITAAATAISRIAPPEFLSAHTFFLKTGETLPIDRLRSQLALGGYQPVTQVAVAGEYSVRGGLIDLFPMGATLPYRIELFGDEVETIRCFDPDTQRTLYPVPEIRLLPAREFPLSDAGRNKFRQRFRETFEGDASRIALYKDVSNGALPGGIEYYLPLFFNTTATLFDYLPEDAYLILHRDVPTAIDEFWRNTANRYALVRGDSTRPVLTPNLLYLSQEEFFSAAHRFPHYRLPATPTANTPESTTVAALPQLAIERKANLPIAALQQFIEQFDGRVLLLAESPGRRGTIAEYLTGQNLQPTECADFAEFCRAQDKFMLAVAPISGGFILLQAKLALITENELYAATARPRHTRHDKNRSTLEGWLRDLSELRINDPVVHEAHGIARYRGLVQLDYSGEGASEFLHLEYADNATLYVPVSQLQMISRYSGADPEQVTLHRLGSGQWEKAKRRAAEQVHDTAAELLDLYAQRALREGYRFSVSAHDMEAFADGFGFEETPDQMAAINAVAADMQSGKPMDRLVCGDVGFGKTEVALRAAFMAVASGKQVALLCPTTLLCEQHYQTFADRFAMIEHAWPARVAELSRFKSAAEQTQAITDLAAGKIDILIGTHRLLQKDVQFSQLGLVIIDEEHRFGVRQKEALKALRAEVDVLSLTATPIPRTLGLALEGLRDFSVIGTAPARRLAIKTMVARWSDGLIREAVMREFKRGGQVYFLHNEVDNMARMHERLEKLLPEARIIVGHGQLPERELERVMREFTQQKHNLLLCSTIIETGIDNPHANTIIINRADKLGLAQLHQLRGRVGRSHHQAFAYLLTHTEAKPSAQAQRRLDAIAAMEELGAGFYLAMHDLEIRGAGEILGDNQSGEMQEIGFALYANMLNTAVAALKQGDKIPDLTRPLAVVSEIDVGAPALLPEIYCPDVHQRLALYKRLSACQTEDELIQLREELTDRFGALPEQAKTLIETHRLRLTARRLGIIKLETLTSEIRVQFMPQPPINSEHIIRLIQQDRNLSLAGPDRLLWRKKSVGLSERLLAAQNLLAKLNANQ